MNCILHEIIVAVLSLLAETGHISCRTLQNTKTLSELLVICYSILILWNCSQCCKFCENNLLKFQPFSKHYKFWWLSSITFVIDEKHKYLVNTAKWMPLSLIFNFTWFRLYVPFLWWEYVFPYLWYSVIFCDTLRNCIPDFTDYYLFNPVSMNLTLLNNLIDAICSFALGS